MSVSLSVGNLDDKVGESDLAELFRPYGTVLRVWIPTDRETRQAPARRV